jgi:hypothetical protein
MSCEIWGGQSGARAGSLRVLRFPLPVIPLICPHLSSSSIIRGWYNRPKSGLRTKWTQSHPTPRNQTKPKIFLVRWATVSTSYPTQRVNYWPCLYARYLVWIFIAILPMPSEIMITQCAVKVLYALVAGNSILNGVFFVSCRHCNDKFLFISTFSDLYFELLNIWCCRNTVKHEEIIPKYQWVYGLVSIQSQINPVHITSFWVSKIRLNVIYPPTSRSF